MEQLQDFSDDRLVNGCIYCRGLEETREHVPSKVLLDQPFPENLPVVKACFKCNNSYSHDEEYVACLIECMIAGSTDPQKIGNQKISKILTRHPALQSRIENAKFEAHGQVFFTVEEERFLSVIRKLATGHAVFELGKVLYRQPSNIRCWYFNAMTDKERDNWDIAHVTELFGEIGCRNMQRMYVTQITLLSPSGEPKSIDIIINDWVDVQDGKYRYIAIDEGNIVKIKIVLSEFIACEITWNESYLYE